MLFTRNYKKFHSISLLYYSYINYNVLGYTDNLLLTNKGFLKSPLLLFNNNMCLFINLNKLTNNYNSITLLSYKGFIISNKAFITQNFIQQIKFFKINNFLLVTILHHISSLCNILLFIILKLNYFIRNYKII